MSFSLSSLYKALQVDAPFISALRRIEIKYQGEVYCVGGCIRDSLLDRTIADIDLVVPNDAMGCARMFAGAVKGAFVPLDTEEDVGRVVFRRRMTVDFASYKGPTLADDLAQRDFTINAMACRLSDVLDQTSPLIDPLNGLNDLHSKTITAISEKAFQDDPLRLLRAYRFAAQLDFTIEPNTRTWIARWAEHLPDVSPERIQDELAVLLAQTHATPWIRRMYESGVLQAALPELTRMYDANPDAFRLLDQVEQILDDPTSTTLSDLERYLPGQEDSRRNWTWLLRLAALLLGDRAPRDRTKTWITQIATVRLRLSNREQKSLQSIVRISMELLALISADEYSDTALYDIARMSGDDTIGVILLVAAICKMDGEHSAVCVPVFERLLRLNERRKTLQTAPRLITGNDLMAQFNLPPGPELGVLLSRLETELVTGDIQSREEALATVAGWLSDFSQDGDH